MGNLFGSEEILADFYKRFYKTKVKNVMRKSKYIPLTEKDAPIDRVLAFLSKATHVWVTESKEKKKVVGVITEHDVLSILAPSTPIYGLGFPDMRSLFKGTAEDVMSRGLIKCEPEDTIERVLDIMKKRGIRRLPVTVKDDIIIGEIKLRQVIDGFISALFKKKID